MITIVYTYFGQKERIPAIVEQGLKTVIVDDCSPEPLDPIEGIKVYRVLDDIKWNQPGARNLGFHVSEGWIICADIDHLVTKSMVEELEKIEWKKGHIYFLGREDDDTLHNFFLIHKEDYDSIGGWDEDFCGNYGHDDTYFGAKSTRFLTPIYLSHIKSKLFHLESSSIGDRDPRRNLLLLLQKLRGDFANTPRLRFNWEEVK
jgi:hypothetical protein